MAMVDANGCLPDLGLLLWADDDYDLKLLLLNLSHWPLLCVMGTSGSMSLSYRTPLKKRECRRQSFCHAYITVRSRLICDYGLVAD
ncbi:hypothetical protein ACLOJK_029404 [Asimina triloba]